MPNTPAGSVYNSKVFYSPGVLRTYVTALLDVFNDIKVRRYADDFITIVKEFDVPIQYGHLSKEYMERKEDATHEGGDRYYQTVPRMSLILTNISRDPNRAKSVNEERELIGEIYKDDPDSFYQDYEPTPMIFNFELKIRARSTEDTQQILEQIVPYFNPDLHLRVKELPFLNIERDIQVDAELNLEWSPEMDANSVRVLDNTISLTLYGYMYRPVTSVKILKSIYRYFAYLEDNGTVTQDRRVRTLLAETEGEIPDDAVNKQYIQYGNYWLYELIDNEQD